MVDAKLVDYVRTCLSRGISVEQIKKTLTAKGWNSSDVDEAISMAGQRAQPVQRIYNQRPPAQQLPRIVQGKPKMKFNLPSKNLIFISVGIFAFILIAVIIFLVVRNLSAISSDKLSEGVSVDLKQDKEIKFKIDDEEHTIIAKSILEDSVSMTIQSSPITETFIIGETKKFDFEEDGTYDLSVKLESITDGKAIIYLKKISEACVEDWDCTEWTDCEDGEQTRTCTDLTECGTTKNKPDETQECELILNCGELGGLICDDSEICDGDITNSSTGDCCLGDCIEIEAVDCGTDIDCFIFQTDTGNCNKTTLTYTSDASNETWDQTDIYYFEMLGIKNEKCPVSHELTNSFGMLTSAGRDILAGEGKNETEINQIEQAINNSLSSDVGKTIACNYTTSNLLTILETTNTNDYFILSSSDKTANECSGDLFS